MISLTMKCATTYFGVAALISTLRAPRETSAGAARAAVLKRNESARVNHAVVPPKYMMHSTNKTHKNDRLRRDYFSKEWKGQAA